MEFTGNLLVGVTIDESSEDIDVVIVGQRHGERQIKIINDIRGEDAVAVVKLLLGDALETGTAEPQT